MDLLHQTAKKLYALNWHSYVSFNIDIDYDVLLAFQGDSIVFTSEFEGRFGPYDVDFISINISKDGEVNIVNLGPLLEIKYADIKEYTDKVLTAAVDIKEYAEKVLIKAEKEGKNKQ